MSTDSTDNGKGTRFTFSGQVHFGQSVAVVEVETTAQLDFRMILLKVNQS